MRIATSIVLALLVFSAIRSAAQSADRMSFGIIGGVNFQNLNGENFLGEEMDNDLRTGYHIGVNLNIPVAPEFYFQPGLLYSTKGAKMNAPGIVSSVNLGYLEVPLNFMYRGALGNGFILVGAGPYVGYGIGGEVTTEANGTSTTNNIEFTNTVDDRDPLTTPYFRPLDAGGNIFFAYEMGSGIFFQFNVQLGMINISPEYTALDNDKTVIKNTGFGFSAGYRF